MKSGRPNSNPKGFMSLADGLAFKPLAKSPLFFSMWPIADFDVIRPDCIPVLTRHRILMYLEMQHLSEGK
jgi:hypothetical protein